SQLRVSCFFFQAEDGIRDRNVTGVQTCALPIWLPRALWIRHVLLVGRCAFVPWLLLGIGRSASRSRLPWPSHAFVIHGRCCTWTGAKLTIWLVCDFRDGNPPAGFGNSPPGGWIMHKSSRVNAGIATAGRSPRW